MRCLLECIAYCSGTAITWIVKFVYILCAFWSAANAVAKSYIENNIFVWCYAYFRRNISFHVSHKGYFESIYWHIKMQKHARANMRLDSVRMWRKEEPERSVSERRRLEARRRRRRGVSIQLGGLGSAVSSPSGSGRTTATKRHLVHF